MQNGTFTRNLTVGPDSLSSCNFESFAGGPAFAHGGHSVGHKAASELFAQPGSEDITRLVKHFSRGDNKAWRRSTRHTNQIGWTGL